MDRRRFLNSAVAAGAVAAELGSQALAAGNRKVKILGIACSTRKGKTTATALGVALEAAGKVDLRIETELVDLGEKKVAGWGFPDQKDDFDLILGKLKDPDVGGIVIGSPVYFRSMSSLCKAFIERCAAVHKPDYLLSGKAVGVLAVGAYRNGGQELVIEQIQTAMLCHEVMIVGGKPAAFQGATLWNNYNDDIMKDEFGIDSAKKLGIRAAEAALKLA
jgi:multimeric flavodoxin WrbA